MHFHQKIEISTLYTLVLISVQAVALVCLSPGISLAVLLLREISEWFPSSIVVQQGQVEKSQRDTNQCRTLWSVLHSILRLIQKHTVKRHLFAATFVNGFDEFSCICVKQVLYKNLPKYKHSMIVQFDCFPWSNKCIPVKLDTPDFTLRRLLHIKYMYGKQHTLCLRGSFPSELAILNFCGG